MLLHPIYSKKKNLSFSLRISRKISFKNFMNLLAMNSKINNMDYKKSNKVFSVRWQKFLSLLWNLSRRFLIQRSLYSWERTFTELHWWENAIPRRVSIITQSMIQNQHKSPKHQNHSFTLFVVDGTPSNQRTRKNLEALYITLKSPNQVKYNKLVLFKKGIT